MFLLSLYSISPSSLTVKLLIPGLTLGLNMGLKMIFFRVKEKRATFVTLSFSVVPPGIEPGTQGFSVLCSTNWAMAPSLLFNGCKSRENFWNRKRLGRKSGGRCKKNDEYEIELMKTGCDSISMIRE